MTAILQKRRSRLASHDSVRGGQNGSKAFQRLLADRSIDCSMSRSDNVWNNAGIESYFSSLKTERIGQNIYRTQNESQVDVFDCIDRFYNSRRLHSTISYESPITLEAKMRFA